MADPEYLARLAQGNIGVVQGEASGGIGSIDIDDDAGAEEFLKLNPDLRGTLRRRGMRGCNVWFYPEGEVPATAQPTPVSSDSLVTMGNGSPVSSSITIATCLGGQAGSAPTVHNGAGEAALGEGSAFPAQCAPFMSKASDLLAAWLTQAGLKRKGCCHVLRHTCATHMLEDGADIRFIQQLLGHEKLDTTAIYTEVSIKQLQEVHARCHPSSRLENTVKEPSIATATPVKSPA